MKTIHSIFAAVILFMAAIPAANAAVQVSVDFFHDHLDPYGDWREVGDYGYVWQPRDVDRDWRPYSDGRWLYTDAGWTWDSDEPYSWAVYHYGRWVRLARVGWVWVPGTEWGPAWVSWRRSDRYVGWAPLPPEARFIRETGFGFGVDVDFDIGPANYRFILTRDFGAPRLRRHFIEPRENITIINQTTNITNISYVNNVIYNQGPNYDAIARQSALPVRRLRLERSENIASDPRTARAEQLRSKVEGDTYRAVAPSFDAKPAAAAPRKVVAKVEKAEVDRGWKNAGPPAEVEKLRKKIKSEPAPIAEPAPQPKKEQPAEPPIPTLVPDKVKDGEKPPKPAEPVRPEAVPAVPEKPMPPESPAKPGKPAKKAKPQADELRPLPPVKKPAEPSIKPKADTERETPRPKTEAPPKVKDPERKPKEEVAEPKRKLPPQRVEKIQPDRRAERPKAAPVRKAERVVQDKPEPRPKADRPDARKPAPDAEQPEKEKGKKKKKAGEKPEEAPQ